MRRRDRARPRLLDHVLWQRVAVLAWLLVLLGAVAVPGVARGAGESNDGGGPAFGATLDWGDDGARA